MRSTDVTSFTEHRANMKSHFEQVRETGRPLFVTTNGATHVVVMSPQAFDEMAELAELARSVGLINEAMREFEAGQGRPAKEVLREIAENLRVKFDS